MKRMMKEMMQNLKTTFPNYKVGHGLFYYFNNPVWKNDFDSEQLDQFFFRVYGQRYISPFIEDMLNDNHVIDHDTARIVCDLIYNIYGSSWEHLYNDMDVEYNPIENTDVYETTTDTKSGSSTSGNTRTLNTSAVDSGTAGNTRTLNTTNTQTTSSSVSTDATNSASNSSSDNKYGFDSANPVGDKTSSGSNSNTTDSDTTSSGTATTTDTGTITDAGTSGNTRTDTGTITDAGTGSLSESFSRTYRKHGNIGIQTAVDMLKADVEFWKWSFMIQVFEDILHIIALSVY